MPAFAGGGLAAASTRNLGTLTLVTSSGAVTGLADEENRRCAAACRQSRPGALRRAQAEPVRMMVEAKAPKPLSSRAFSNPTKRRQPNLGVLLSASSARPSAMPPIRLPDSELDAVFTAARPLPVERRDAFLQDVATLLRGWGLNEPLAEC
jgi:hypothetical protein